MTYASSNTNVFEVDTNGNITPGLTPGTATLTITYQTKTLNTTVTNLAPTSCAGVVALPNTVYLEQRPGSANGAGGIAGDLPRQHECEHQRIHER